MVTTTSTTLQTRTEESVREKEGERERERETEREEISVASGLAAWWTHKRAHFFLSIDSLTPVLTDLGAKGCRP